jgi:hypothetical protein
MRKDRVTQAPLRDNGEAAPDGPDTSFDPDDFEADGVAPERTASAAPIPAEVESAPGSANGSGPDPFDPVALRLSSDSGANLGVRKALLTVPVRKPDKAWFLRVHPGEDYALQTAVIELKEDRETYLVAPQLWQSLAGESTFSPRALFTALNRQGVLFLWPIRLPGPDGKVDSWSQSALEAAQKARNGWIRVAANLALGAYEVWEATGDLPEATWPEVAFRELLRIAFKDRLIASLDHPILRRLRGEV